MMQKAWLISSAILAVSSDLCSGRKVYLEEAFDNDVGSDLQSWTHPSPQYRDENTQLFSYDRGNYYVGEGSIGLYTRKASSKYLTCRLLDEPLHTEKGNFVVEFKVTQEEGQLCGDAQISLFGNTAENSEDFKTNRLTMDSPRLLRFGTHHCKNIAYF